MKGIGLGLGRRGGAVRQANSRAVGPAAGPKTTRDLGAARNRKDARKKKKLRKRVSPRFSESAVSVTLEHNVVADDHAKRRSHTPK